MVTALAMRKADGIIHRDLHETLYVFSKEFYNSVRNEYNKNSNLLYDDFLIGWVGWMASFKGRFFDGGYSGKTKTRDYIKEQINNTEKQINNLKNVIFKICSYEELDIPPRSVIYCDIPYKNTKQYATSKDFDYDRFWEWCRIKKSEGHFIFTSEYEAPEDFKCIWSKEITNTLHTTKTYSAVEKLFTL